MKIVAVIPTLGERPELAPLVSQLNDESVEVITINQPKVRNIHKLWNEGARLAKDRQADYIAVLNDDLKLPPMALKIIAQAMESEDFACVGVDPRAKFGVPEKLKIKQITGRVGDLMTEVTTWCFVVKATAWVDIDERYRWWWGVGDLFEKIVKNGDKLGQMIGLGIVHFGSGTAKNHSWTEVAKKQDGKLWRENH